ncbi:MAG: hypothetical protein DIU68_017030, partial [Chloroflexota bacterium]
SIRARAKMVRGAQARYYRAMPSKGSRIVMFRFCIVLALLAAALVACGARPSMDYRTGDVLLEDDFSRAFAWTSYDSPERGVFYGVDEGVYRIRAAGGSYISGTNAQMHDDVVIEVYSSQLSDDDNNAYGVVCRGDPAGSGEGYYFLISGDGYWSIRRAQGRRVTSLRDFARAEAIHQGRSLNLLRVVCIGDYLALYVNDEFVGEARDRTFSTGFAGFVAVAPEGSFVEVAFDNLRILEGRLVE